MVRFSGLAFCCMFALAFHVQAADSKKGPKVGFKGKLVSHDSGLNTMVVAKGSRSATFAIDKNVKVIVDQKPSDRKIADIPLDCYLQLILNEDKSTVVELRAEGPSVYCTIEAVNREDRTLRIKTSKQEETYPLVADVPIKLEKLAGKFEDVKPGAKANIKLTHDSKSIVAVTVRSDKRK